MGTGRIIRPESLLWFQHNSMQFSDSHDQMSRDLHKIFGTGAHVITFTEAHHSNPLHRLIPSIGRQFGYQVWAHKYGLAIAVKKSYGRITRRGYLPGIKASRPGDAVYGPRGIAWVRVRSNSGENIGVGVVHAITGGDDPRDGFRYRENRKLIRAAGRWAKNFAVGTNLAFISGDFNKSDRKGDLFWGQPLTTCWDELKKWPNTGHGNIDAIASWDADSRVRCIAARAYDDKVFKLETDHFMIRATYRIKALRGRP